MDQFTEIHIGPLKSDDVRDIMVVALDRHGADIEAVADLVHGISSCNPFFANEILISPRDRGLIRFDTETGDWQLDQARLAAHDRMIKERRADLHMQIGNLMLSSLSPEERERQSV